MNRLPKGVSLRNLWKLIRQFPLRKLYKIGKDCQRDPEKASEKYQEMVRQDMAHLKALQERGPHQGLQAYANELFQAMSASFEIKVGLLFFVVLGLFKDLDKQRREGKTEEICAEYDALCGGYEGDDLMELNKSMYRLTNMLPQEGGMERIFS